MVHRRSLVNAVTKLGSHEEQKTFDHLSRRELSNDIPIHTFNFILMTH
jgi:hypothetical protein